MSKAVDELERLSRDPEARRLVDTLERDCRFRGHELAVEREEGVEEGQTRARRQVARRLLGEGMSPSEVARLTDLSLEAVAELVALRG